MSRESNYVARDLIRKLFRAISTVAGRGMIRRINHATKVQSVQIETGGGTPDDVEYVPTYGVISNPAGGASTEGLYLCPFGQKEQMLVFSIIDRTTRPTNLEDNDSGSYHAQGHMVLLSDGGHISLIPVLLGNVHLGAEVAVKGVNTIGDAVSANPTMAAHISSMYATVVAMAARFNAPPGPMVSAPASVPIPSAPPAGPIAFTSEGSEIVKSV